MSADEQGVRGPVCAGAEVDAGEELVAALVRLGRPHRVWLWGELDESSTHVARDAMSVVPGDGADVDLDLGEVSFLGMAGVRWLAEEQLRLRLGGGALRLCRTSAAADLVLDVARQLGLLAPLERVDAPWPRPQRPSARRSR